MSHQSLACLYVKQKNTQSSLPAPDMGSLEFPIFVNTVLLGDSHLSLLYGCFHTTIAELYTCDRNHGSVKPKVFI
jgi:hypothetical protein